MRVSDTERQRTVEELRRHCAAGRIDMDEYGRRIEKAMAAERLEELDAVLSDLPILRIADPSLSGDRPRRRGRERRSRDSSRVVEDLPPLMAGDHSGGPGPSGEGLLGRSRRTASTLTALLAITVVAVAVILVIAASWTWGALLVVGWALGLLQSAASRRRSG